MPFFPQLPEVKTPQLFKGDIPTLLKDMSQLRSEAQLREMRGAAMEREKATVLPPEEVKRGKQLDIDIKQIKKTEALMNLGLERLKTTRTIDEYNAFREGMIDLGVDPAIVPELGTDEDLAQYKDDIRQEISLWKGKAGKGTPLQNLYSQLDTELDPKRREEIQQAINKEIGAKPDTEELTLYHKDGRTKRVARIKGAEFDPTEIYGEGWSLKAPSGKAPSGKAPNKMKNIADDYMTQIGRYYQSKRGVGQFIQDPNKEQVAEEAATSAENLAIQYVKEGGDPGDLGITKEGIRNDLRAEKIDKEKAIYLLRNLFGMD